MQGALRAPFDVLYSATPENPIPKLKHNGSALKDTTSSSLVLFPAQPRQGAPAHLQPFFTLRSLGTSFRISRLSRS
jgi:hypothetical protein